MKNDYVRIPYTMYASQMYTKGPHKFYDLPKDVKNKLASLAEQFINVCEHDWKYEGKTHGGKHYVCVKCDVTGTD